MSKGNKDLAAKLGMSPLGEGYEPTNFDVVCARGRIAVNHTGNKRFKIIVEQSLQRYSNAPSKLAKSAIVSDIVDTIRKSSPGELVTNGFIYFNEAPSSRVNLLWENIIKLEQDAVANKNVV